jgi:NAD(P)-dependent dehydrogenase (short-subunit alcohol dehydrogenase family)
MNRSLLLRKVSKASTEGIHSSASHTTNASSSQDMLTNITRLDALVNNAAIGTPSGALAQQMSQIFQTNATGPLLMVESFAPLLKKSTRTPRIVNVSSGGGSITTRLDPTSAGYKMKSVPYRASKAALNMITACQAVEYDDLGFKVFVYCPGFTVSNLGPYNKAENGAKPTSEGAAPIVKILNGERDAEHGKFLHATGQYSW